jgi:hypothetical protein
MRVLQGDVATHLAGDDGHRFQPVSTRKQHYFLKKALKQGARRWWTLQHRASRANKRRNTKFTSRGCALSSPDFHFFDKNL